MKAPDSPLGRLRHSLAHVLAQAMQRFRPGTLLGFGPPIDDGFYYDFIIPEPGVSEDDLPELQKLMEEIIAEGQEFTREDLPTEAALISRRASSGDVTSFRTEPAACRALSSDATKPRILRRHRKEKVT